MGDVVVFSEYIVGEPASAPKVTQDTETNRIISAVLANKSEDAIGYQIIYPKINPSFYMDDIPEVLESNKKHLIDSYTAKYGRDDRLDETLEELFAEFIEVNSEPSYLSVKSSPEDGYYVDYDGKFSRYFREGGGGWLRMLLCRPGARPFVELSMPAYDPDTGIVLMYIGWQSGYLIGSGDIWFFKLVNEELETIRVLQIWVS